MAPAWCLLPNRSAFRRRFPSGVHRPLPAPRRYVATRRPASPRAGLSNGFCSPPRCGRGVWAAVPSPSPDTARVAKRVALRQAFACDGVPNLSSGRGFPFPSIEKNSFSKAVPPFTATAAGRNPFLYNLLTVLCTRPPSVPALLVFPPHTRYTDKKRRKRR